MCTVWELFWIHKVCVLDLVQLEDDLELILYFEKNVYLLKI